MASKPGKPQVIEEHPSVTQLTAGEGTSTASVVFRGYLGRSPIPDTWRLYSSIALNDFIDIPSDAIVRSEVLPHDQGNRVWVRQGTILCRTTISTTSVQAGFLAGSISG